MAVSVRQDEQRLSHQRLRVYGLAVGFRGLVGEVLGRWQAGECADQLARASTSVVLNIAEGAGRRGRADKRQFYVIARGSAQECSAIFDVLLVTDVVERHEYERAQALLLSIVRMLSKMIRNLEH